MVNFLRSNISLNELTFFSTHEIDWKPDSKAASEVCSELGIISNCSTSLYDVISNIRLAEYVIATRYHGFVIGLLLDRKSIGVDYTPGGGKLSALCQYLKIEKHVVRIENVISNEVEFDSTNISSVNLATYLDTSSKTYDALAAKL